MRPSLIPLHFFTLIKPEANGNSLFDNILGPSVDPDGLSLSIIGNRASADLPPNSNNVLDRDRPTFA